MNSASIFAANYRCEVLKTECENRSNQSDFVIWPNSFYQLSADPKKGNLASVFNDQHNQHTMDMEPPFSISLSTRMVLYWPLKWLEYYYLPDSFHKPFLLVYHKTAEVYLYPCVRRWRWWWEKWEIDFHPWWVSYR